MDEADPTPPPMATQPRSRARLLVVDDDPKFRTVLCLTLTACGLRRPREAQDVEGALRVLEGGQIDLVLLDWWLRQIPGIELVQAISLRQIDVSIIMLTAEHRKDYAVRAMRMGVTDYLLKPYTRRELIAKIDNALSARWGVAIEP
jgi:DNA-binding response OmpR family regulator